MNELSLFTGAGGGLYGTKLLGWRTLGYVEYKKQLQKTIAQRIEDGIFDRAPIFGDIRKFISEGYAESYKGMVDVITAGPPCQPFSVAGNRAGRKDPRNMWPATLECIGIIRPRFCLLENVPGLVTSGYFGTIMGRLAESGYHARWRHLSAAELGAPHYRNRVWIVVHSEYPGLPTSEVEGSAGSRNENSAARKEAARESQRSNNECSQLEDGRRIPGPGAHGTTGADWWNPEPDVVRVVHGVADGRDRIRALGNGQVPVVETKAWKLLTVYLNIK